jgi:hypothetical protein
MNPIVSEVNFEFIDSNQNYKIKWNNWVFEK